VRLVVGTTARARSWADVLTVAAFAGGLALLGALASWTGRPPPGAGRGGRRRLSHAGCLRPPGEATAGTHPPRGVRGGTCGLWADTSRSELRLLRQAIRRGWPVPQERRGPIMEEVRGPLGDASTPARVVRPRLDRLVPDHERLVKVGRTSHRHVICPT
jgi:hypothetical protein